MRRASSGCCSLWRLDTFVLLVIKSDTCNGGATVIGIFFVRGLGLAVLTLGEGDRC